MRRIDGKIVLILFLLISAGSFAQITSGRIVFERKTNLMKRFGKDPRLGKMITEENKYRIENFELLFNDTLCVYKYIDNPNEADVGFLKYLTSRNTVHQNIVKQEKVISMDLWGTPAFVKDSIHQRQWKITDSKRMISGYNCRKAIWEMNDSTRIYAWYSLEVVPSMGPEGFAGLPGTILGMATEDGSVVYFAKEIKEMTTPVSTLVATLPSKDVYTEEQLKAILAEKMKGWMKPGDLEAMFKWL